MTIACAHASFTKALVDLAGADVSQGVYGVYPTVNWGDDVPGMAKMTEYARPATRNIIGNNDYIAGWASSLINAEIIRQAMKTFNCQRTCRKAMQRHGKRRKTKASSR